MAISMLEKPAVHTAEDLERLSAQGFPYELIRGELRERMLAGGLHGSATSRLSYYAGSVIMGGDLGTTFAAGTGFLVGRTPDTVLAPDFAFVAKDRLPDPLPESYVPVVPDIVLETRSPSSSKKYASTKVRLWLKFGVRVVWKMNPRMRLLTIYRADQTPCSLGENDTLDGGDVLPGLSVPIARLFL